jgi:hypothetical protein
VQALADRVVALPSGVDVMQQLEASADARGMPAAASEWTAEQVAWAWNEARRLAAEKKQA